MDRTMSEPARNRFALDLEDLERQLRGAGQAPRPGQQADPLAELTRIVGQDDPLKDIFAERRQPPRPAMRQEPSFEVVPPQPAPAVPEVSQPPAEMRGALDEFEALLRRTEPRRAEAPAPVQAPPPAARQDFEPDFDLPEPLPYPRPAAIQGAAPPRDLDEGAQYRQAPAAYTPQEPAYDYGHAQQGAPAHDYGEDDLPDLEPRRSRKGLWAAAAVIAVGIVGVGAAFTLRGGSATKDGQPPVITADSGPVKVAPANPGGAEIPNQNKQIYERSPDAPPAASKVVNNEEQPVDVQQAARSMPPRVVMPGPISSAGNALAAAPTTPERSIIPPEPALTPMPPVPGLGEPRKVRTVSIRPDGTPAQNPVAVDSPVATGSAPSRSLASQATSAVPQRPAPAAAPPKVEARATTPPAATTPVAPTRLASAAPAPAAAPPAPATAAVRAGTGDFVVQLGAPGSEAEARATFAALQRKYPQQLGGQSPIVRKTELAGGKTVFRLRVGPYSREDATSMCSALQAAGGQCFIAKN
jgi:hypothetical protein